MIETYLLKAPSDLMRWWKQCASDEGIAFAEWLRIAAHERAGDQPEPMRARVPAIVGASQCSADTAVGTRCRYCGRVHGFG